MTDKPKTEKPRVEVQESERNLKHVLTDAEKLAIGAELADGYQTLSEAEGELAAIKADYKGRIDSANALIGRKSSLLRSGYEMRMTDVRITKDWGRGMVITVRLDTMDIVEERMMTNEERQMGLNVV